MFILRAKLGKKKEKIRGLYLKYGFVEIEKKYS